jgi:signal transduction histidine kinase
VFERFYRGDKSRSTPGSGLGLSLARAIVRAHGGEIAVKSAPHQGTTFHILLPSQP